MSLNGSKPQAHHPHWVDASCVNPDFKWYPPQLTEEAVDLVIVIAFQKRHEVLEFMISLLFAQLNGQINVVVLLACSDAQDLAFCQRIQQQYHQIAYVLCDNQPLGNKWQIAIDCARKLKPENLMISGSDDYISASYILESHQLLSGTDDNLGMAGVNACFVLALDDEQTPKVWKFGYKDEYAYRTLGTARMYSSRALDAIDWQLFERARLKGLDGFGQEQVKNAGFEMQMMSSDNSEVVLIKGSWDMMNPMEAFYQSVNGIFAETQVTKCEPKVIDFLTKYEKSVKKNHQQ